MWPCASYRLFFFITTVNFDVEQVMENHELCWKEQLKGNLHCFRKLMLNRWK